MRFHHIARQRQLADVEFLMAEGPEEDLLRLEQHEDRLDTVHPNRAVHKGAHPVIIADGASKD